MPDEMFDNETGSDEQELSAESAESEVEAEEAEEEESGSKKPDIPEWVKEELRSNRESRQRAEQEAHALRMQFAQFQFQNQQVQKKVLDPEQDQLRQLLRPILDAELEPERERRKALEEANYNLQQVIQADTNIRLIESALGDDYDEARKLMIPYLESKSERSRNSLLENPDLFIEKAQELLDKSRIKKVASGVQKARAKHEGGETNQRSRNSNFDPATASDEEFNKYLRSRGIL